ncbi:hypothetical protein FPV67DRAFT_1675662 [Lyophyllum atratum]|nr:hypothetical protein FPV67DRAFT_1675662 [Lyophyllum atratum]
MAEPTFQVSQSTENPLPITLPSSPSLLLQQNEDHSMDIVDEWQQTHVDSDHDGGETSRAGAGDHPWSVVDNEDSKSNSDLASSDGEYSVDLSLDHDSDLDGDIDENPQEEDLNEISSVPMVYDILVGYTVFGWFSTLTTVDQNGNSTTVVTPAPTALSPSPTSRSTSRKRTASIAGATSVSVNRLLLLLLTVMFLFCRHRCKLHECLQTLFRTREDFSDEDEEGSRGWRCGRIGIRTLRGQGLRRRAWGEWVLLDMGIRNFVRWVATRTVWCIWSRLGTVSVSSSERSRLSLNGISDVYCHICNDSKLDPELSAHLAAFGIDVHTLSKTEFQIELSLKYDFSVTGDNGKALEPLFGPASLRSRIQVGQGLSVPMQLLESLHSKLCSLSTHSNSATSPSPNSLHPSPEVLVIRAKKFQLVNWAPSKLDILVVLPPDDVLKFGGHHLGCGVQASETESPHEAPETAAATLLEFNLAASAQLEGMDP